LRPSLSIGITHAPLFAQVGLGKLSGDNLEIIGVFTYANDIWIVPKEGGTAY